MTPFVPLASKEAPEASCDRHPFKSDKQDALIRDRRSL